jgi:hypothetical protein
MLESFRRGGIDRVGSRSSYRTGQRVRENRNKGDRDRVRERVLWQCTVIYRDANVCHATVPHGKAFDVLAQGDDGPNGFMARDQLSKGSEQNFFSLWGQKTCGEFRDKFALCCGVSGTLTFTTRISAYLVDMRIGTTDTLREDVTRVNTKDVVNHSPQQLTIRDRSDKLRSP